MDGMDMSGTGMTGMGSDVNHRFARAYWYITATVVGSLMVVRGVNHVGAVKRYVNPFIYTLLCTPDTPYHIIPPLFNSPPSLTSSTLN